MVGVGRAELAVQRGPRSRCRQQAAGRCCWRDHHLVDPVSPALSQLVASLPKWSELEPWMAKDLDADLAEAPGRVLVEAGGRCPRDELGRPRSRFRPGDVLRVSCPPRETAVVEADRFCVCVRWPWRWLQEAQDRQDQAAGVDNSAWRGQLGFDRDRDHPDAGWLFRFDPALPDLVAGDRCRVGIPPTVVHVLDVFSWRVPHRWSLDPPASLSVQVFPQGVPHDLGRDHLLDSLRPYGREPIRVELLFRPYPHLRDLDVVADRHGRRWVFCAPWWWVELGHDDASDGLPAPLAGPAWPLTLLGELNGVAPAPERAARVVQATAEGDHGSHLAAWSQLTAAAPLGLEHQSMPGPDGHEPLEDRDRVPADTRADLAGMTFTQILGALVHSCARRRMVGTSADELEVFSLQRRLQVRAAEMASVLRELRTNARYIFNG